MNDLKNLSLKIDLRIVHDLNNFQNDVMEDLLLPLNIVSVCDDVIYCTSHLVWVGFRFAVLPH